MSVQRLVYIQIHAAIERWISSDIGRQVDFVINRLAGSYVIGNGAAGTAAHHAGGAGGWLAGNGGAGWDSTEAGVAGGGGGRGGLLGDGGRGGAGGAGAAGGAGGAGGFLLGIGGSGGAGGTLPGGTGGAGGRGGAGVGLLFGVGGTGGHGGDGADGGRGGTGGSGSFIWGFGGNGGDAGNSGVGGASTGLPALGGAGGNAGLFGTHGAVGHFGTGATLTGTSVDASGRPLSTTGNWITNGDGQVVILHGVNQVYKLAPYDPSAGGFSEDDAAFLQANGFNQVRLGVIWAAVEPEPGVYNTAYLDSVNQTVQMLASHGIYTILDMHQDGYSSEFGGEGAPAWASKTGGLPNIQVGGFPITSLLDPAAQYAIGAFWANSRVSGGMGLEDHYAQMWEHVANYFKGDPNVAGYEIMNEPYPTAGDSLLSMLGGSHFDRESLTPFYNQVASAIRAVDPNTPVYFEPNALFDFGVRTHLGTVDANHTVFSYHPYSLATFGGGSIPDVAGITNMAMAYARAHGIPAMVTEFGTIGSTTNYSTLFPPMNSANQHAIGWSDWAYTGQSDITGSPGTEWLVKDPSLPPVGDNVDATKLAILAQPYPQAISGTPQSWSYANGTFQFSYATQKADGTGSFAAGAQTIISTPTVEFPSGYQVTVTGGHVVSAPNAPQLVIASDDGAATVRVVVTAAPAGTGPNAAT